MENISNELIEKAKTAKNAEELLEIAKANNVEMTAGEAATYFAQLNPQSGELDDDDLDKVAGGSCNPVKDRDKADQNIPNITCENCNTMGNWAYIGQSSCLVTYYCRHCRYTLNLQDDENFAVPHFYGTFY